MEAAFKELLEGKHLYQNFNIKWPAQKAMLKAINAKVKDYHLETLKQGYKIISKTAWGFLDPNDIYQYERQSQLPIIFTELRILPRTIKIHCRICERNEPFNFLKGQDILAGYRQYTDSSHSETYPVFTLDYQCQSCHGVPEVFMVQRSESKISIVGRSPMEITVVKNIFPKSFRKYISGAIIAFQSGQILPANFMLRTFIEQYLRSVNSDPTTENVDSLFEEYNRIIPEEIKQRIPSLREIYDSLSTDMHGATGSEMVYQESLVKLEKHFDMKRVFEVK